MTLQQLAEKIHKSRASLSKYENGEITLDVETLYEISTALGVDMSRLTDFQPVRPAPLPLANSSMGRSPFYQADRRYFYFYDGRYNRLKDGIITINKGDVENENYEATLTISAVTANGRSSDMLIRFSFVNQYNTLEEDLLYIFNPLELRDFTEGLLCGISSADLMPCAFKCWLHCRRRNLPRN